MWRIADNLFLGQASDSTDLIALRNAGISHIVNCAAELPCCHAVEFQYLHLQLKDPDPSFASAIPEACQFVNDAVSNGAVLVHCQGAISRSPSVVLAYLCSRGHSLQQAASVVSRVVQTKPNRLFLQSIIDYYHFNFPYDSLIAIEGQLMGPPSNNSGA